MVENRCVYNKERASNKKVYFLEFLSEKRIKAFSKMRITFEGIKLKSWGLRSFVDLHFAVLIHTGKSKNHFFKVYVAERF